MSFLTRISLAYRSLVGLITVGILLIGAIVIPLLRQEIFPSLAYPALTIMTPYPGASPASVERDITNPLEQVLQGLPGVQQISSYSNQDASVIQVLYTFGIDQRQVQQELERRVGKAQSDLPPAVTPQVLSYNVSDYPIIQLAVTSASDQQTLAQRLQQDVLPAFQAIPNVGDVTLTGVRQQLVLITLDPQKLQTAGISVQAVQQALQNNNIALPAGELSNSDRVLPIRVWNTFQSLEDLQNVQVSTAGGALAPVVLSEVATVQQVLAPSTSLTRTNGRPSLGIGITQTSDGNVVAISQAVKDLLPGLQHKLGHDTRFIVVADDAPYIQTSISDLVREGLIGALFAILVILVFLLSLRSTLVTAISIPLSIVIALIGLWTQNYSLNLLTLGGLTIAVGRVVDDSIVVLENIYRHVDGMTDKQTAIRTAVREVAGAVTASTLTTVAVFLPLGLAGGIISELFRPFSIAVTVALLASLLVALTVIPVLAYWFVKPSKHVAREQAQPGWLARQYMQVMQWAMKHRWLVLGGALLVLIGSLALSGNLATGLLGSSEQNSFYISQTLAPGTSLHAADQAAQQVEAILLHTRGIQQYQVTVGASSDGSGGTGGSNQVSFSVTTYPQTDQTALQNRVRNQLNTLHDAGTVQLTGGGLFGSTIQINVQATDLQTLQRAAQQVFQTVAHTPHTLNVSSNLTAALPFIDVHVDPRKAQAHGLSVMDVARLIRLSYAPDMVTRVSMQNGSEDVDLKIASSASTAQAVEDERIPTPAGTIRLGDLATISETQGPTQIAHINSVRTAIISATATGQDFGAVSNDVQNRVKQLKLPSGASFVTAGGTAQLSQAFVGMLIAALIAILLVYLTMVATFRSLIQPLLLLVAIPFAATGSILLMLITRTQLGVPALIGLLMLIGIVVTNAIVLLDLVNQYRRKGLDARMAVIEGGRQRLRPILMTALATILALVPMALSPVSSSAFIAGPLAIVVIGGLASSTLLTLLVVPTLYVLLEDLRDHLTQRAGRASKVQAAEQTAAVQKEMQDVDA